MSSDGQNMPFAHMVFFTLADRSMTTRTRFVEACHRYLGGHDGQTHFSVGTRATEMQRPVSDLGFNVAMHMVFSDKAAYEAYTRDPRHEEFITATAGLSTDRRVFDSYLIDPPKTYNADRGPNQPDSVNDSMAPQQITEGLRTQQ